jgi:multiple sugar transport system permease protein/raffinose/stachyose/melibiose transport system permease protein
VSSTKTTTSTKKAAGRPVRRRKMRRLTGRDKLVLGLLVGIPLVIHLALVWFPAIASVFLSFTDWDGIGLDTIHGAGLSQYVQAFTNDPSFWPAVTNNVLWLLFLIAIPTPFGIFLAYQLDKKIRFSRFYQTAIFLPMVISLAVVGFIWQIFYQPDYGLLNSLLGTNNPGGTYLDWLGDPSLNLSAVLVAAGWRHTAYIMILYLAGLKSFDPTLREAAAIDGANERQTFFRITFPSLRPVNVIILVVTVLEGLRAFDLVYVMGGNTGSKQGLELLSILITNNIVGESGKVGYGSALAVILLIVSLVVIIPYLVQNFRKEQR